MTALCFFLALAFSLNSVVLSLDVSVQNQAFCQLGRSTNLNTLAVELAADSQLWLCDDDDIPLANICDWDFLTCGDDDATVSLIVFDDDAIEGSLPSTLCNLDGLVQLVVKNNKIGGSIPDCIGNMSTLATIDFESLPNLVGDMPHELELLTGLGVIKFISLDITGTIPTAIWTFTKLYILYLDDMQNLSHSVLPSDTFLPSLETLDLSYLPMSGRVTDLQLSASISQVPVLSRLSLLHIDIIGALPPNLGLFTNLVTLQLEELTHLTGTIPTNIFNLVGMTLLVFADLPNITGTIPSDFSKMTDLNVFFLQDMPLLTGSIDSSLGELTDLISVIMRNNPLMNGSFPEPLIGHPLIVQLDMSDMPLVTGSIPTAVGSMAECGIFNIQNTAMNGTIPTEIGQLGQANFLRLSGNSFSSTIPSEIGAMGKLAGLDISNEPSLDGTVPDSLGSLAKLTALLLFELPEITGSIPSTLNGLSSLVIMNFFRMPKLTGTIPSDLGTGLTDLETLLLSNTSVNGPVPDTFGDMTNAFDILVSDNSLTGTIPGTLCLLNNLVELDFSFNNITCYDSCLFDRVDRLYGDEGVFSCPGGECS